jgi:hypothetical protein
MNETHPETNNKRKRTVRQQEAARRNGAKSKGPKTEEGKKKSSRNSYDHGLFSISLFVLEIENSAAFHHTFQSFLDEWRPSGPTEESLVHSLAFETIAQQRYRMMEAQTLNGMIDRLDVSLFKDGRPEDPGEILTGAFEQSCKRGRLPNFESIQRAIARSGRNFRASLNTLLQLRKSGQPAPPSPAPVDDGIDRRPPTPPGEPSESLERRIAEFKRRQAENAARKASEQTNPGPTQTTLNQPLDLTPLGPIPVLYPEFERERDR